ncbi:MAG: hypothetical protein CVV42_09415 [Candidatus Riflebacteria bacterium HGW-Riflebacteria-2]|jgi:phosphoglycerol transferase MdoB-like AlkP superfamily enzyme|nr:MAG: hypothetical protein CVV42_09415 [Candidatus Riflebacteria bacterium HGW-Riflebacteria-2]
MILLIAYSVLIKVFHYWHVIAGYAELPAFPGFVYISATFAQLLVVLLILRKIGSHKLRFLLAFLLNIVLGIYSNASYMYYRMFAMPMDFSLFLFGGNVIDISDSIVTLLKPSDFIMYVLDIVIIAIFFWPRMKSRMDMTDKFLFGVSAKKITAVLLMFMIAWWWNICPIGAWTEPFGRRGFMAMVSYGPIGHLTSELARGVYRTYIPQRLNTETKMQIRAELQKLRSLDEKIEIPFKDQTKVASPDIIIIQVESLMNTFLHAKFKGVEVMPVLSDLASRSVYLKNFYSHAVSSADSDFSMLTSLLPLRLESAHLRYSGNRFASLPHELKRLGYYNIYGVGVPKNFWNTSRFNTNVGFDKIFAKENLGKGKKVGPWLGDESLLEKMADQIALSPQPLFCMIFTSSTHHPFNITGLPEVMPKTGLYGAELELANYANALNYADQAVGNFINRLKSMNRLQNSIIIIYGDHPVLLDSQADILKRKYGSFPDSERLIRFLNSNIPCMIYAPWLFEPQLVAKYCGQIDIAPTILSVLGRKKPSRFLGNSVFSDQPGVVLHKNGCGRNSDRIFYQAEDGYNDSLGFQFVINASDLQISSDTIDVAGYYSIYNLSKKIIEYDYVE